MSYIKLSSPVFKQINGETVQVLSIDPQATKAKVLKVIKHTEAIVDYDPSWYDSITTNVKSLHNISTEEKHAARGIIFKAISQDVNGTVGV